MCGQWPNFFAPGFCLSPLAMHMCRFKNTNTNTDKNTNTNTDKNTNTNTNKNTNTNTNFAFLRLRCTCVVSLHQDS